ncbi:orphan sodium- and chloride-dependent neurotransmitter transporter NTT5-like [Orycteropus afer afer]|uniref:Transporter n=1 Tax=Orycteropus afer afer TaxID=1230840 RepID=A0A8B7A1E7_ORYAF|nr:orphan sodium- and chloride-dependent neurotransmitter transporter NTT5-like [Orycteropus afer afer]
MESLEELSDGPEEKFTEVQTSNLKEIQTTKTQDSFAHTKKTENTLIQVAFSVGLSNMWRFPYMCHRNGGGSFILMYFFMLLLVGTPLLYIEMVIGQRLRVDNIRVWKQLLPWLGGMGYTSMLVCFLVNLYNGIIISWSFSYLSHSFHHPLPWNQCPLVKSANGTDLACIQTVPHQYFWYHTALHAPGSIEEGVESLVLNLTVGIFTAWFLLFLIMITELKISVPMLISLVFLPYVILLCFLIRSLFLEGTVITFSSYKTQGNVHNFTQVVSMVALINLLTSLLPTTIIFLVLGFWATTSGPTCIKKSIIKLMDLIAKGLLPPQTMPPEKVLLMKDVDYTEWLGSLPQHLQHHVIHLTPSCSIKIQKEKIMEGPGLVFVAFSQVISSFPGAPFFAIIFFLAVFITGLSTLMKVLEGISLPLQNAIPIFRKHPKLLSAYCLSPSCTLTPGPTLCVDLSVANPDSTLVVICLGGLLGSLVFTSRSGSYIMSLFDEHLVPLVLVIIVTFQHVTLACIYRIRSFHEEMFTELGPLPCSIFVFLWSYVALPGLLALLTICFVRFYQMAPPYYTAWNGSQGQEVRQPYLPSNVNWFPLLLIVAFLPIPTFPLLHWKVNGTVENSYQHKEATEENHPTLLLGLFGACHHQLYC